MKRILLTSILLFSSAFLYANNLKTVDLKPTTTSTIKRPRSGNIIPKAEVDVNTCQLTISIVSGDSFTVYVYDGSGGVVYQGSVVTDGSRQVYLLPELEVDLYTISIESNSTAYEGEFHVN